jgi:hypothetical protein
VLDAKIESIRLKNLKILERQKIVEADKEWAIEQNKQYRKLLEEESEGNPVTSLRYNPKFLQNF